MRVFVTLHFLTPAGRPRLHRTPNRARARATSLLSGATCNEDRSVPRLGTRRRLCATLTVQSTAYTIYPMRHGPCIRALPLVLRYPTGASCQVEASLRLAVERMFCWELL